MKNDSDAVDVKNHVRTNFIIIILIYSILYRHIICGWAVVEKIMREGLSGARKTCVFNLRNAETFLI